MSLNITICKKMEVLRLKTFHQWLWISKIITKARCQREAHLNQIANETCYNVRSCKMSITPPFKLAKITNEKTWGTHPKS
jgi:hypothetical protein